MGVKGMIGKMLYLEPTAAEAIKEIAETYECSESSILRKALQNYIGIYQDLAKHGKEYHKKAQMTL